MIDLITTLFLIGLYIACIVKGGALLVHGLWSEDTGDARAGSLCGSAVLYAVALAIWHTFI